MLYLGKKRSDGQSAICIQFLRAFTLRHPCGLKDMLVVGSGIEDGSVLSSLLYLYQNLQESLKEDLVEREACEFIFSHLKVQDHGFPMCGQICTAIEAAERDAKSKTLKGASTQSDENAFATDDNDNCKSTQDAAMEEMKRKQNAFLAQMEEDTDDESESDSNSAGNSSSDSESITDDEGKSDEYDRDKLIHAHTVKGKIQTDNCNDTCIFCHEVCGNKLYGYVGFSFQPASNVNRFGIKRVQKLHKELLNNFFPEKYSNASSLLFQLFFLIKAPLTIG